MCFNTLLFEIYPHRRRQSALLHAMRWPHRRNHSSRSNGGSSSGEGGNDRIR
jgi:hypothetical protein